MEDTHFYYGWIPLLVCLNEDETDPSYKIMMMAEETGRKYILTFRAEDFLLAMKDEEFGKRLQEIKDQKFEQIEEQDNVHLFTIKHIVPREVYDFLYNEEARRIEKGLKHYEKLY